MKYIECPQIFDGNTKSLFLAGGITGCPDWQKELVCGLALTSLTLLNPRRKDFDITNPEMESEQIHWEHEHLEKAPIISFWFPRETLCPISLFELGKYLKQSDKMLFVGTDSAYKRRRDLEIQIPLVRPDVKIHSSLQDLISDIKEKTKILIK